MQRKGADMEATDMRTNKNLDDLKNLGVDV